MRSGLYQFWAGIRWVLLMFLVAPGLEAPAIAYPSPPRGPLRVWYGVASWYGEPFHGRITANGETYDMYAPTAAHPSLPMGCRVRVLNLKTGQSRVVRINDRGPFIEGREIDVSYEVARSLGFDVQGLARLRLELLEVPESKPRTND